MANLDTAAKRASGINVSLPFARILPFPDGAIGQGDRQALAQMYSGIAASSVVVVVTPKFEGLRQNIGRMMR